MSNEETKSKRQGRVPVYYAPAIEGDPSLMGIDERLRNLELTVNRLQTERAVDLEKQKFMEERFNQLDTRLDTIDGHVSRLVWLLIATIIGGFMSFIFQGGLTGF